MKTFNLANKAVQSFTVAEILEFVDSYLNDLKPYKELALAFERKTDQKKLHGLMDSKNRKTNFWSKFIIENGYSEKIPIEAFYGIYLRVEVFKIFLETLPAEQEFWLLNVKTKKRVADLLSLLMRVVEYRAYYGVFSMNVPAVLPKDGHGRVYRTKGAQRMALHNK